MKRIRLIALGAMFAAAAAGYFGLWLTAPSHDWALKGQFERVQNGMTKQEVEKIFGHSAESSSVMFVSSVVGPKATGQQLYSWSGRYDEIASVVFDEQGLVGSKDFMIAQDCATNPFQPETFLGKVRRWLAFAK